jgi:hypothetical protein
VAAGEGNTFPRDGADSAVLRPMSRLTRSNLEFETAPSLSPVVRQTGPRLNRDIAREVSELQSSSDWYLASISFVSGSHSHT